MCKGLAHKIFETYKVVINIRDISTWVYAGMYDGGRWTRFRTYRGDQSIFAWTATCASQIVFKELDKQHLIPPGSDLNATNTSLTLNLCSMTLNVRWLSTSWRCPISILSSP